MISCTFISREFDGTGIVLCEMTKHACVVAVVNSHLFCKSKGTPIAVRCKYTMNPPMINGLCSQVNYVPRQRCKLTS